MNQIHIKPTIPSLSAHYCTAVAQGHEGELMEELNASKWSQRELKPMKQNEACAEALNAVTFLNTSLDDH